MAFHFPLQSILQLRRSEEHQQELRLRAIHQQITRLRHGIEQLEAQIQQIRKDASERLQMRAVAAELRFSLLCEQSVRQHALRIETDLERLNNLREQQQRIFQQARRERETLENLRDQQFAQFCLGRERRQQRSLDDLFLQGRAFRKHS